jgi:hypothetical protein
MPQAVALDAPSTDMRRLLVGDVRGLGSVFPLQHIQDQRSAYTAVDRQVALDQAILLLDQCHAHRSSKQQRYGEDPVALLRELGTLSQRLSDGDFHWRLLRIFKNLRDSHTRYTLPPPFSRFIVFLPFTLDVFHDCDGQPRFVVARVICKLTDPTFSEGVEVLRWNHEPVGLEVCKNGAREEGSHAAARFSFGMASMTVRWLGGSLPPIEQSVRLHYLAADGSREIEIPWHVLVLDSDREFSTSLEASAFLLAQPNDAFEPAVAEKLSDATAAPVLPAGLGAGATPSRSGRARVSRRKVRSFFPAQVECATLSVEEREYGYLRLRSFDGPGLRAFGAEIHRLLQALPTRGLLLDVRDNWGGAIQCAESLLQLFTRGPIRPLRFRFATSPLIQQLMSPGPQVPPELAHERLDLRSRWRIGEPPGEPGQWSAAAAVTPDEWANCIGQQYFGPVILLTSGMTYSAADMFAAGFQDHGIGPVLGTAAATAGGGGSLWSHDELRRLLPEVPALQPLPHGARMHVAVRRCLRERSGASVPLEDVGVTPDIRYYPTRPDVLNQDEDLLYEATRALDMRTGAPWTS